MAQAKVCVRCGRSKPAAEFYSDKRASDGLRSHCKECHREQTKKHCLENPGKVIDRHAAYRLKLPRDERRAKASAYYQTVKAKAALRQKRWVENNPEKRRAHYIVQTAIRSGRLAKPSTCSWCGATDRIEASHDDYSRPLDVDWLCPPCHRQKDLRGRSRARTAPPRPD